MTPRDQRSAAITLVVLIVAVLGSNSVPATQGVRPHSPPPSKKPPPPKKSPAPKSKPPPQKPPLQPPPNPFPPPVSSPPPPSPVPSTPGSTPAASPDCAPCGDGSYYFMHGSCVPPVSGGPCDHEPGPRNTTDTVDPNTLDKFADLLPSLAYIDATSGGFYSMGMYTAWHSFHHGLPLSKVYAYGTSQASASYPGPVFIASRNVSIQVQWSNHISDSAHMFSIDPTINPAQPKQGGVPTVVHLHGGETAAKYDGNPRSWFTSGGETGPGFVTNVYNYTNQQPPATLYYHDHALGYTAINVVAGLVGGYLITDPEGVEKNLTLPSGSQELLLFLSDRSFFKNGSVYFPNVGEAPAFHPIWIPEYFGDNVVVNGKVSPYTFAERRPHRLRIVNAAAARYFNLHFICADTADYPLFNIPLKGSPLQFSIIGADGGYLNAPVSVSELLLAPAQRVDLVVDFSQAPSSCDDVILVNDAVAPYPGGDAPDRNTALLMRIFLYGTPQSATLPTSLSNIPPLDTSKISITRHIEMVEYDDPATDAPVVLLFNGLGADDPATETPTYGTSEIWYLINLTEDAHPIHIHLVSFRVLLRQTVDTASYKNKTCSFLDPSLPTCYTGTASDPLPQEQGWIDTLHTFPREMTILVISFQPRDGGDFPFDPTAAPGYVWHCHILNHEDNKKMRPLIILPKQK